MMVVSRLFSPLLIAAFWWSLAAPGWSQTHPWEPAQLSVSIERSDPFSELETRYRWESVGEIYHAPHGDLSAVELASLREMLLASREQVATAAEPLPPQPAALVQRIVRRFPWLGKEPFPYTAEQLAAELAANASDPIATAANSYTVQATLPGDPVLTLIVSNRAAPGQSASPGAAVWSISDGRTSWNGYSPQLAVALTYLLKGTAHHDVVERVYSQNNDFLDRKAQREGERLATQLFAREHRHWPGYAAIEPYIAEARLDFWPGEEAFYWVRLKLQGRKFLKTAALSYPVTSSPKENWEALAADLEQVDARIAETAWLRRALDQSAALELRSPSQQDRASWREAGLSGQPDFALVTSHGLLAETFLLSGSQDASLLLFPTEPTLRALSTAVSPRPSFLLIGPNGDARALKLFP